MFSATVPAAIEKLAQDFQKDALRVTAMGEARQHGDIAYRALSVAPRDRENAIFNLLRFYEAKTAIIFCKTRANVNHLLARMGNRGFRVVALSGELSQQERTHALQALRDGRARVCIATDVAARGIDLPGLELVIHADLPTNYEILLHRSGRTGRAGAKGVSALVVTPADYKKAQRLLAGAKVVAEWGKAPSAEEVSTRDDERMLTHPALTTPLDDMTVARDLLAQVGAEQIAAAFVQLWREGRPPPEELGDSLPPSDAGPRAPREFGASVWFALSVGHTGRAEARWLLPKICEAGHITREAIGAIRVREEETYVQIATADAPRFGEATELEPGLTMRRLQGEPVLERPAGRPAPHRGAKPRGDKPARPQKPAAARPETETPAPAEPAWSPADTGPTEPPPARAPRAKPRWSAEQKAARGRKPAAAPAAAEAKAPKGKGWAVAKPAGKPAGKPGGKPVGKPRGKYAAPRRPENGNAPPRRPKGRG
ncbi:MAG: helicase-related protein [Paracoccus sp. (in: a-proteobacteria)]